MEDIHQFIECSGAMILLTDSTNCPLELLGDKRIIEHVNKLGLRQGVLLDEGHIGTNAFAVALIESFPVQVIGPEHFLNCFHSLSSVAAPIHNLEGHPIGSIGLLEMVTHRSPQSFGIAVVAAKAIENQIQSDLLVEEANNTSAHLNVAMNATTEGILSWTANGTILHLNKPAGHLLGLTPNTVVGRPLAEYITIPEGISQAIARGEELNDIETAFSVSGVQRECLASLRVIRNSSGEPGTFIVTLRQIEQIHQLVNRLVGAQARLTLDDIVGHGESARRIRRQALAAAYAKACVLLVGESGTSKNVLARAIHNSGKRAAGPFLAINCRAIPRQLALGEFLGFEAGAFNTGPSTGQPSKFELANGGTIFLDEVEALPLETQAALLRVIEMGDVIRLGGTRVIPIDTRIIASTTCKLDELVAKGTFRSDLYHRLSSFVIHTLPLRERPEDIPLFIDRILKKLSVQVGQVLNISTPAQDALCAYPWPGNIRELESVLEQSSISCEGQLIQMEHLPDVIRHRRAIKKEKTGSEPVRSLAETELLAIITAGRASRANLTQTSLILGISRTTLWRKMKELNISVEDFR
jgi:transcriptional activator for dhaKLM operon